MTETILLLEDDTTLLWANQGFLEMAGLEVLACTTVQEAREAVWERMPDLMILDVMLPDGSGVDFCREYREYYGNGTPVLFLTVLDGQEDMLAGYEAGGADYLVKPFDLDILLLKVRALLQNKKAAAETLQLGSLYLNCRTHIAPKNSHCWSFWSATGAPICRPELFTKQYGAAGPLENVPSKSISAASAGNWAGTEE